MTPQVSDLKLAVHYHGVHAATVAQRMQNRSDILLMNALYNRKFKLLKEVVDCSIRVYLVMM